MFFSLFLILLGAGALIVALVYALSRPSDPAPEFPPMAAPPTVSTPISCFVKGLIRSMRESSDQWTYAFKQSSSGGRRYSPWSCWSWTHVSGMKLTVFTERRAREDDEKFNLHIPAQSITPVEERALLEGVSLYLDGPRLARLRAAADAEEAERLAALAAKRAPFEALGCPSGADSRPNLNAQPLSNQQHLTSRPVSQYRQSIMLRRERATYSVSGG